MKQMIRHEMPALYFGCGRGCVSLWLIVMCLAPSLSRCCYTCFTTPQDQVDVCTFISERTSWKVKQCQDKVKGFFQNASEILIPYSQKDKVKELLQGYTKSIKKEDSDNWFISLERLATEYTARIKDMAAKHKPDACKPPCGLQKAAQVFSCKECLDVECDLPVDCPLEDVHIREPARTSVDCNTAFTIPEDISVTWKFAERVRTKDLSYFKNIHTGEDLTLLIQPTRAYHQGTYACEITDEDDDVIAIKFFFVNVSRIEYTADSHLGEIFDAVVRSPVSLDIALPAPPAPPSRFSDSIMKTIFGSEKSLSSKATIYLTVAFALVVLLVILACGAVCYYANDVDFSSMEDRMRGIP
ncbi:sperm acrosome membrane-associated protein 6-like [Spea bombifrons]|uniref:sperm acrosome membrane-associated protein 6-like n=1 Tax=Spea bombifrons TaxID=233779 RepID=UPI00234A907C|nr:sperm acrosome membrane-associated protein 6-like [Spea bombifrons]